MVRSSILLCICLAGCASVSADEKSHNDDGTDTLRHAIVALCEKEQGCLLNEESSVQDCVNFLWDVAHHSYPSVCYDQAARYAHCLGDQACDTYEDLLCDNEALAVEACADDAGHTSLKR